MNLEHEIRDIRAHLMSLINKVDQVYASLAPSPPEADSEHVQALPRTQAIEWVLDQRPGEDMRPVQIWQELQRLGRSDPKMEVQVTTFDLWERGRIGKSGRGLYHAKG